MASSSRVKARVTSHMQHLKTLQTSFAALDLTDAQRKKKAERKLGRALWEKVLAAHRGHEAGEKKSIKDNRTKKKRTKDSNEPVNNEERQQPPTFRFLDLPPEVRNAIYVIYLDDVKDIENGNDMRLKRRQKIKTFPRPGRSRVGL